MLKRKEWKELSEMEKKMYEWFEDNLNGDSTCSALFAVDLYEQVIAPLIQESNREVVEGFDAYKCEEAPSGVEKMTVNQAYVAGQVRVCLWIKDRLSEYLKERGNEKANTKVTKKRS